MHARFALLVGLIAAAIVAPPVFAEATGGSGGSFSDLWEMAKAAGPFGTCLCFFIWQLERRDRMKLQSAFDTYRDTLLERMLTTSNGQTQALADVKRAIERSG